jgi:hypothetical protein
MQIEPRTRPPRRYRCYFTNSVTVSETGTYPFVQLRAESASMAERLAYAVTGAVAIVCVQRIEEVAS